MASAVGAVLLPAYEARRLGPVHQLHDRVVTLLEHLGQVGDRRPVLASEALYGQEQLVLGGSQARRPRLLLGEAQELPQCVPEPGEGSVLPVGELVHGNNLSLHDIVPV